MYRQSYLHQALRTLFDTAGDYKLDIIVVIDEDEDSNNFVLDNWKSIKVVFNPERTGALSAWNQGLKLAQGDILFPAGDDTIFHPGWLDYALESHKDRLGGYGCVGLNDGAYDGNRQVATTLLFDRQFCKDIFGGVIAVPVYKYYCVDLELNERAKLANKFYWDERAVVEHIHSAHGKRPIDDVDRYKMDTDWMVKDNILFEERKQAGFPNDFEAII